MIRDKVVVESSQLIYFLTLVPIKMPGLQID